MVDNSAKKILQNRTLKNFTFFLKKILQYNFGYLLTHIVVGCNIWQTSQSRELFGPGKNYGRQRDLYFGSFGSHIWLTVRENNYDKNNRNTFDWGTLMSDEFRS
jgi:hypothetical protein